MDITHDSRVKLSSCEATITPLQEGIGVGSSSLEKNSRNSDSVCIRNFNASIAIGTDQSSKTHSEDNSIVILHKDW
jgi:hypothetical protein